MEVKVGIAANQAGRPLESVSGSDDGGGKSGKKFADLDVLRELPVFPLARLFPEAARAPRSPFGRRRQGMRRGLASPCTATEAGPGAAGARAPPSPRPNLGF
jgi:hypothetical protein